MGTTNVDRAHRALHTLRYYKRTCLKESGTFPGSAENLEETLTDFLTDFYHFFREEYGETPEEIIRVVETRAKVHYEAEVDE